MTATPHHTVAWETVIGLEVHLQFKTKTKIFCGCENIFGQQPNTRTCPVCLGLPGSLPVLNKEVLSSAIRVGLALHCQVNPFIKFDRKNYYYPDLPKNYQISQYDYPLARNGFVIIPANPEEKKIRIHRAHLEEDAGKLIHDPDSKSSFVDYNRTGTPLLEIVTEPDIRSPQEAHDYLTQLKLILLYLDVSDCDMEKGSLRCDANISLRPMGEQGLGTKTEIKNLNSFKAVKAALEFEAARQKKVLQAGEKVTQETRLWNEKKEVTLPMRTKEQAHDYRYFPEPDLVPFTLKPEEIESARSTLPELPPEKLERFQSEYELSVYDAQVLIQDRAIAEFFEACAKIYPHAKIISNWISTILLNELNERKMPLAETRLSPQDFVSLIEKVEQGTISNLVGKDVLASMIETARAPETIIQEKGLAQISDETTLLKLIEEILKENDKIINQIRGGNEKAIGFLIGQAVKKSGGKAHPKKLGDLIRRRLSHE